jgi:hypothetical protein
VIRICRHAELARMIGVSRQLVSDWFAGRTTACLDSKLKIQAFLKKQPQSRGLIGFLLFFVRCAFDSHFLATGLGIWIIVRSALDSPRARCVPFWAPCSRIRISREVWSGTKIKPGKTEIVLIDAKYSLIWVLPRDLELRFSFCPFATRRFLEPEEIPKQVVWRRPI